MIKKCKMCNKEFDTQDYRKKYCSDDCKKEADKLRQRNRRKNMTVKEKEREKQQQKEYYIKTHKENEPIRVCTICGEKYKLSQDGAGYKYCSQDCSDEARRIRNRERWREANHGWDEGTDKVCEWCGQTYTALPQSASRSRFCSKDCQQTWYSRKIRRHGRAEDYLKERRKQKEDRQARLEEERERQLSNLKCIECGSTFKGTSLNQKICSPECRRVRRNKQQSLLKDKRINETNNIDKDISLETLYERDKGICYICGGKCDFKDHVQVNGYFTVGHNYPSIDHIIPIARGGMHAWDNVKLAHHYCNSMKSDILPSELGLDIDVDDAYALASKFNPRMKEVKQLTKDGKLINIYESTAEASRQTGIKCRGIQNCAREECKTYRGFKWEYA